MSERIQLYRITKEDPASLPQHSLMKSDQQVVDFFYWANQAKIYRDLSKEQKEELDALRKRTTSAFDGLEPVTLSPKTLEHPFKLGSWASERYSDESLQNILEEYFGTDLYWIFGRTDFDQYWVTPDWGQAKGRAEELLERIRGLRATYEDRRAVRAQDMLEGNRYIKKKRDALGAWKKGTAGTSKTPDGFFTQNKPYRFEFKGGPYPVDAVLPGCPDKMTGGNSVTFLIIKDTEFWQWVEDGVAIILETVDHVLDSPQDNSSWVLAWDAQ